MKQRSRSAIGMVLLVLSVLAAPATASLRLPAIFGDHMVLQQGIRLPVWGWAEPGATITVRLDEQDARAVADDDGFWHLDLPARDAGGPYTMEVSGSERIVFRDVWVGEVWIGSGQSNMDWPVSLSDNPDAEIAAADQPRIRLFQVGKRVSAEPLDDVEGRWVICSPETVKSFSAVAYYFGRELHQALDVPVGLIQSAWGGTPAESWTDPAVLAEDDDLKPILARWERMFENYDKALTAHRLRLAEWEAEAVTSRAAGELVDESTRPKPPEDLHVHPHRPGGLFHGMIRPLIPFGIRGAIWYQGESNTPRAFQYRKLFPAMIRDWRQSWGRGDFHFLFVQLANFKARQPEPGESEWAELREAQLMTLGLPNTGMAVTVDIGDADDIHPRNKQDVGRRLALWALASIHGHDVVHSGPTVMAMTRDGEKVRVQFHHVGEGLRTSDSGPVRGFAIAGEDRKFVWAEAELEPAGDTLLVWHEDIPVPMFLRYAWADNPEANLVNSEGLPASPFRSDDLPGLTHDRR